MVWVFALLKDWFWERPKPNNKMKSMTPWKIDMEHNHGGLEDHFPF